MRKHSTAIFFAILAAALYAISAPCSKMLISHISPTFLAGLLYIGAGLGMGILILARKISGFKTKHPPLDKTDLPYTVAMVALDIAAPIFLMLGVLYTTSANVSLLNNFEIVATSLIALVFFKEAISKKLWFAIILVVIASCILAFEGLSSFIFNKGSLFVLSASVCWGIENNCTRKLSEKSSEQIVLIKGIFSGLGSIIIALFTTEPIPRFSHIFTALILGFLSYGLSINFYIKAQEKLGAAKTSAFYSIAPFLGVGFSFILLHETPNFNFYTALTLMAIATILMIEKE